MTSRIVKGSFLGKALQLGMILILLIPSFVFSAGRNYSPRRRATSPSSRHSRSPSPTMSRSSPSSHSSLGHSRSPSPASSRSSSISSTSSIHLPSLPSPTSPKSKGATIKPGPPRTSDGSVLGSKEQRRILGQTNLKRGMEGPYGTESRGPAHPKELAPPGGGAKAVVGRVMEDTHQTSSEGRSFGSLPPILKRPADAKSGKSTGRTLGGAANVSGSVPFVHPVPEEEPLPERDH